MTSTMNRIFQSQWGQMPKKPIAKHVEGITSHRWLKAAGIAIAIGLTSELVYFLYKRWKKRKSEAATHSETKAIEEVLFFPDSQIACKDHFVGEDGCSRENCRFTHEHNSLSRLYEFIDGARETLDVCVFVICCADLGDLLILAHRRHVKVRVICDDEQIDITGSQIWKLRKAGIAVRTDNSSYLMHHKFVVIDGHTLLTGSFNWTRQAISGNQENLLALNNRRIVRLYGREFEKLWRQFDPRNHTNSALHRKSEVP
ncbi:uncharacterized protein LOC128225128 [Mya arenaria]|nr:uncharacterized protein LOC128225128 [Mya arenaria]